MFLVQFVLIIEVRITAFQIICVGVTNVLFSLHRHENREIPCDVVSICFNLIWMLADKSKTKVEELNLSFCEYFTNNLLLQVFFVPNVVRNTVKYS